MKYLFFLLSFLWASLGINAQNGYYFGDKFVELKVNSELSPYKMSSASVSTFSNKAIQANGYISQIYQTETVDKIIVLPKIIVEIKDGGNIEELVSEYRNKLSLASNYEKTYYLDCNVKTSEEVLALVASLTKHDKVKWCEPDMYSNIKSCNSNPYYGYQYYLKNNLYPGMDINVEPAWNLVTGSSKVTVAVVDTGVDLDHEDLKGALLQGYTVGDPVGYGTPKNWTSLNSKGHGTCCAGIVGAVDNNIGIKGVASGVKILPVNIAPNPCTNKNKGGFASTSEIAQAIRWAYPKADVLSCSWGGSTYSNDIVSPDVVSLTISGSAPTLAGLYYEVLADGTKTYETSLIDDLDGDINYATPPNEVVITSNSFVNRDVYYCRSSESWNRYYVRPSGDQIMFEMPSLESGQTLNFSVVESGATLYTFKFGANESALYNNNSLVSIEGIEKNKYEVNIQNTGETKDLNIDIINITTGAKVLQRKMSGNRVFIDASNFDRGCYVIRTEINGKQFDKKIFVK